MEDKGASVDFYDTHCPVIRTSREHARLDGRVSIETLDGVLGSYDAVLIATDHDEVDYARVVREARLVVDTRNATGGGAAVVRA